MTRTANFRRFVAEAKCMDPEVHERAATVTIVTGTDTNVGKTITTAALVACSQADGRTPFVIKPAQTGLASDPGDLSEVRRLIGWVPGHVGVELQEALAPVTAARWEGVALPDPGAIVRVVRENVSGSGDVFIEGAGGLRVALAEDFDLVDLADAVVASGTDCEFVVVTRCELGTLNHTMLTVDAIEARGHPVRGLVVGRLPPELGLAEQANLRELPEVTGRPLLAVIPDGVGRLAAEEFRARAPGWFARDEARSERTVGDVDR